MSRRCSPCGRRVIVCEPRSCSVPTRKPRYGPDGDDAVDTTHGAAMPLAGRGRGRRPQYGWFCAWIIRSRTCGGRGNGEASCRWLTASWRTIRLRASGSVWPGTPGFDQEDRRHALPRIAAATPDEVEALVRSPVAAARMLLAEQRGLPAMAVNLSAGNPMTRRC